jgi:hypothetical protein
MMDSPCRGGLQYVAVYLVAHVSSNARSFTRVSRRCVQCRGARVDGDPETENTWFPG